MLRYYYILSGYFKNHLVASTFHDKIALNVLLFIPQVMPVVGKSVENVNGVIDSESVVNAANKSNKNKPTAPPRNKEKNGIFRNSKSSGNLDPSSNSNNTQSSRPLSRPTRYCCLAFWAMHNKHTYWLTISDRLRKPL